ncbi:Uncharacterised protein [Mycobacteroides abscessus subsp. abscessus]|nr:Uncharacterised protein [Mycobacteroides abscessus subsp. abscessus]
MTGHAGQCDPEGDHQSDHEADGGQRQRDGEHGSGHGPQVVQHQLGVGPRTAGIFLPGLWFGSSAGVRLEVLLRDAGERPIGRQLIQRLVQVRQQAAVLACGEPLLAALAGGPGDLHRRVTGAGQVGIDGDAVVDDDVYPTLAEQCDGLGEALHRLNAGAGVAGDLRPITGRVLGGHLAPDIGQAVNAVVVGPRHDHTLAHCVRCGNVVLCLARRGDRDLVGDDVEPFCVQSGEDRIPGNLDEFHGATQLLADGAGHVHVVTRQLAGVPVVEAERRVHALGADPQRLLCWGRTSGYRHKRQKRKHDGTKHRGRLTRFGPV